MYWIKSSDMMGVLTFAALGQFFTPSGLGLLGTQRIGKRMKLP